MADLGELVQGALEDNDAWFPNMGRSAFFHAACMAGEAGEVINWLKKVERGSITLEECIDDVAEEITDVFTYMLGLCGMLGIDLEEEYNAKRYVNEKRFGKEIKYVERSDYNR
jgi:NTP pyrophosphatase (non-canonical NTP hydrolase)